MKLATPTILNHIVEPQFKEIQRTMYTYRDEKDFTTLLEKSNGLSKAEKIHYLLYNQ